MTDWKRVAVAIFAGVMAAALIGKFPSNLPAIQAEFQISSAMAGTLAAMFSIIGAVFGAVTGSYSDRIPARYTVKVGMVALIAEGVIGALATNVEMILSAHFIGGFGLIAVTVTLPRMIRQFTSEEDRRVGLGLWGTFMPTGIVIAMLISLAVKPDGDWRTVWLIIAAIQVVYLLIFYSVFRQPLRHGAVEVNHTGANPLAIAARLPAAWLLGLTFICYTIQWFTVMIWLPTLFLDILGVSLDWATLGAAAVIAANILGNILGTLYLKYFHRRVFLIMGVFISTFALMYATFEIAETGTTKLALMFLFSMAGGAIPPALLEGASAMAPKPTLIGTMSGFTIQGSNLGAVIGPPAMGLFHDISGSWSAMWQLSLIASSIGIVMAYGLYRIEHKDD